MEKRKRERAILFELLENIENAHKLEKEGKSAEANKIFEASKNMLGNLIDDMKKDLIVEAKEFDRSILPSNGSTIYEGEGIVLKVISEDERDEYVSVSYDNSVMKAAYDEEKFVDGVWSDFLTDQAFTCSIYDQQTQQFVGYCGIKNLKASEWELAIELRTKMCHKGYGSKTVSAFLRYMTDLTGNRFYRARVDVDNYASQALMKKCGAYPNGISEFMLHGEILEKYRQNNKVLIDEKVIAVAEEFCVIPEDLLGCVLEYRFDMSSK